jgi:hypothetical protein
MKAALAHSAHKEHFTMTPAKILELARPGCLKCRLSWLRLLLLVSWLILLLLVSVGLVLDTFGVVVVRHVVWCKKNHTKFCCFFVCHC